MIQTPTRGRRDSVEIPNERNRVGRDAPHRLHTTEHRVVEVDLYLARRLKAVGAPRLQPVPAKRLHRVVHRRVMRRRQLFLGDRIAVGSRARLVP